jgi:hypothetical protein
MSMSTCSPSPTSRRHPRQSQCSIPTRPGSLEPEPVPSHHRSTARHRGHARLGPTAACALASSGGPLLLLPSGCCGGPCASLWLCDNVRPRGGRNSSRRYDAIGSSARFYHGGQFSLTLKPSAIICHGRQTPAAVPSFCHATPARNWKNTSLTCPRPRLDHSTPSPHAQRLRLLDGAPPASSTTTTVGQPLPSLDGWFSDP